MYVYIHVQFCRPTSGTTVSNDKRAGKESDIQPQEYVVLLADPWLMEMPLEALQALQAESIVSLSREVSLQMLYHKNYVEPVGRFIILLCKCGC